MPKVNIINTDDFAEMRQGLGYYVDKTGFLEEFLQNPADRSKFRVPSDATLFTRPRRFGKTLFMSMLAEFFDITKDSHKLFDGLAVSANRELCAQWMNRYPVIFFSLKDVDGDSFDEALDEFNNKIVSLFNIHEEILSTENIWTGDRIAFEDIINRRATKGLLKDSLGILTRILTKYYQQKAIVLIDEYDAPVARAADNGYYHEMIKFIRGFLSSALKTNRTYLKFGILTGCLHITRESIFSGLNHMDCFDITTGAGYADTFGFTQDEVDTLLRDTGFLEKRDVLKAWYDGYHFGNLTEIYCPWSIMKYLRDLQKSPGSDPVAYWQNTSENALVKRLFPGTTAEMTQDIADFIEGRCLVKQLRLNPTFESLDSSPDNLWTLLYISGYLTRASKEKAEAQGLSQNPEDNKYPLVIPNREIRDIFRYEVSTWFRAAVSAAQENAFFAAFWKTDAQAVQQKLEAILLEKVSSQDLAKESAKSPRENFYYDLLIGFFLVAYPKNFSNLHAGTGQYDISVLDDTDTASKRAAIVEIKRATGENEDLAALAEKGLTQIRERKYDVRLLADPAVTTLLHWSIAFFKKNCEARAVIAR